MNRELWTQYEALKTQGRNNLIRSFQRAPVMQKLIQLIEDNPAAPLPTHQLVELIYGHSLSDAQYPACRNRFYKLRKKLLSAMSAHQGDAETEHPAFTEEETAFYRARKLIAENNYQGARNVLEKLERRARELCLYELKPEIYSMLSVCAGVFNDPLAIRSQLVDQLEAALKESQEFQQIQLLSRRAGLTPFDKQGRKDNLPILKKIQQIAKRFPGSKRFALVYHFSAANHIDVFTQKDLRKMRKHLDQLKALMDAHPEMPTMRLEPGHAIQTHYHWVQMEMIYAWLQTDYATAYEYLCRYWEAASGNYRRYIQLSENVFRNKTNLEIRLEKFAEAEQTVFAFIKFFRENGKQDNTAAGWTQLAFVYARAGNALTADKPDFILRKIEEYIGRFDAQSSQRLFIEAICMRTDFLVSLGRYQEAWNSFQHPKSTGYFEMLGILEEATTFYNMLAMGFSPAEKSEFLAIINQKRKQNPTEEVEESLRWFQKILQTPTA